MGGTQPDGHYKNCFINGKQLVPFIEFPQAALEYSLYTFGFHFGNLILHLIDERERSFEEFLLHHVAACALFFCFVLPNVIAIGCTIAWIHDVADILASLVKVVSALHFEGLTVFVFINMMALWFLTRLVWLPIFIYNAAEFSLFAPDSAFAYPDFRVFGMLNFSFLMIM